MSDSVTKQSQQLGHLFVLIHGLWGSANHLITIERMLTDLLPTCSKDKIVCLRPSSFSFWRTYDGLQINSARVISEIFYEIETLKQKQNLQVTKISIVGYSLGGLIARHVVGSLYECGFFDVVEPVFFTTFATPHVGVEFYKENIFDYVANKVGRFLFGKSGLELFIADDDKLLLQMSQPDKIYLKGLKKFQLHAVLANVKNDRTVAFFTSYITEYSPYDHWSNVKIKYIKGLPQARIGTVTVKPKFVDLTRSHYLSDDELKTFEGNVQEQTSVMRTNKIYRFAFLVLIVCVFLPVWIPLVLFSSFWVSIYSMIKIRIISVQKNDKHWQKVKETVYGSKPVDVNDVKIGEEKRVQRRRLSRQESFKGDTSKITGNTMEMFMYEEERLTGQTEKVTTSDESGDTEDTNDDAVLGEKDSTNVIDIHDEDSDTDVDSDTIKTKIADINVKANDDVITETIDLLKITDLEKFPLFTPTSKLKLDETKRQIVKNLNEVDWIKIPVYIDAWNAHDGIVARRGPKTNPKGTSSIGLWCSILRNHLKEKTE